MNVIAPASGAPSFAAKPTTQSPRPGARSGMTSDFPETVERVSATTRVGRPGRFDKGDDEVRLEQRSDKTTSNSEAEAEIAQSLVDEIVLPADSFTSSFVQQTPVANLAGRPASLTPQPPRTPVAAYARAANLQSPIAPARGAILDTII